MRPYTLSMTPTGPGDWLLTFRSAYQEILNPGLGNRETRGGWLVRDAAREAITVSILNDALEELVARGWLTPVRYAPVEGPLCAPDPGTGCATTWPPFPRDEPYGWQGRKSPAWAWVFRVEPVAEAEVRARRQALRDARRMAWLECV